MMRKKGEDQSGSLGACSTGVVADSTWERTRRATVSRRTRAFLEPKTHLKGRDKKNSFFFLRTGGT